jgi:hypothetical protein
MHYDLVCYIYVEKKKKWLYFKLFKKSVISSDILKYLKLLVDK